MRSHIRRRSAARRGAALMAGGLSALLVLTGCATDAEAPNEPSAPGIQQGGTLTIGIPGEPGNLDQTMASTLASNSIFNAMCELLYNAHEDAVVFPQLAADDPVFNDDHTVATVTLRKGLLFHDGTPVNADAVKFSIDRYLTHPGSLRTNELDVVEKVTVVDDLTVEISFKSPIARGVFDGMFAHRVGTILSPTAVEELGDEGFAAAPVCSGPFKFESRIAQDNVTLVKDPNYHQSDKVHLDKIVYRIIPDSNVRAMNLKSGDLQVIERLAPTDIASIASESGLQVNKASSQGFYNLIFNIGNVNGSMNPPGQVDSPFAKDARIRKAFEMSIDREAINKAVFFGEFDIACGFMAPISPLASDKALECNPYDPEGAKKLLKDAGVTTPLQVEIMINQQPEFRRIAELVQSMTSDVGFDVTIDVTESVAGVDRAYAGDFDIYFNSWSGHLDMDNNISFMAKSDSARSTGKYSNPRVDELLLQARATGDTEERTAMYADIHQQLLKDVPFVFLLRPPHLSGSSTEVTGVKFRPTGTVAPAFAGFVAD